MAAKPLQVKMQGLFLGGGGGTSGKEPRREKAWPGGCFLGVSGDAGGQVLSLPVWPQVIRFRIQKEDLTSAPSPSQAYRGVKLNDVCALFCKLQSTQ